MIWGVVKQHHSVRLIARQGFARLKWQQLVDSRPDMIKPRLELSKAGLYLIYQLDDYLFRERSFEKNDHEYRIRFD